MGEEDARAGARRAGGSWVRIRGGPWESGAPGARTTVGKRKEDDR